SASRPANTVLEFAAEKGGWGLPLPQGFGRGVALHFVFATYMAQMAEVEGSRDGSVRIRRVVCAVDCGLSVNPDTVGAQLHSVMFGVTASLCGFDRGHLGLATENLSISWRQSPRSSPISKLLGCRSRERQGGDPSIKFIVVAPHPASTDTNGRG